MESIAQSAVAGVIAAVTVAIILGLARYVYRWWARRQDVQYIRALLIEGRERTIGAKDTFFERMDTTVSADAIRAAQYNNMLKQVRVALEKWAVVLSHDQRRDISEALDLYYPDPNRLPAKRAKDGQVEFVDSPEGGLVLGRMRSEAANQNFERLKAIKWLKLNKS